MGMRHLLDSNIWIHYFKQPTSALAVTMAKYPRRDRYSCSVVLAELLHGAQKYGRSGHRSELIRSTLGQYESLSFDDLAAVHFARVKHELELTGFCIGPHDLQIAAICLAHDLTLITGNVREFSRVPGLRIEDWSESKTS